MALTTPNRWGPFSFRSQLAASFAVMGGLVAVALALVLGHSLSRQAQLDESLAVRSVAELTARQLAGGLSTRLREVQVLAESPTLWSEGLGSERVRQVFFRSQALNPHSAWIGVASAAGRVVVDGGRLLEGADVSTRPWFLAGSQTAFVGDVHPAKLLAKLLPHAADGGPQRFIDFAAPIRHGGKLLGVVAIHGSWDWTHATIAALMPEQAARRELQVFIFDRQGLPIYAPAGQLDGLIASGQRLPQAPRTNQQAARKAVPAAANVVQWRDGQDYLTAVSPMAPAANAADLGWTVVAREPVALALAAARGAAALALLMGLAAAAALAAAGWWLAGRLTRPLKALAAFADQADSLALEAALPAMTSSIEIEKLSSALFDMTRRLRQSHSELEQKVKERTEALEVANSELAQLAQHDPLTGLLNRRGLDDRLGPVRASARRSGAPVSVLVFDIDHFKTVNDRFGHDTGDEVLRSVGEALRRRLREADILARSGGEEFVAVLPDTGSLGASLVATSIVERIAALSLPTVGRITISCGVTEWHARDETAREALARADSALYEAKATGRNRCCVAKLECQAESVAAV